MSTNEFQTIGVVILNWNGADDTCRCLTSLKKSEYPEFRTIVIDNGSRKGQVSKIKEEHDDFIDLLIENGENMGYAAGNNIGIRRALEDFGCSHILILNNDTLVEEDTISQLVRGATEENAGIVGPKIMSSDEQSKISSAGGKLYPKIGEHRMRGDGEIDEGQYNEPEAVDFVSGGCVLVSRDVFEAIGLIPTYYFLQWEDIDFCTQARKSGFKVLYWPKAVVYHEMNASFERESKVYPMIARGYRNRIWYFKKYTNRYAKIVLSIAIPLYIIPSRMCYYLLFNRDLRYAANFFKGIYLGITKKAGEGADPDPEVRDVAELARSSSTEL